MGLQVLKTLTSSQATLLELAAHMHLSITPWGSASPRVHAVSMDDLIGFTITGISAIPDVTPSLPSQAGDQTQTALRDSLAAAQQAQQDSGSANGDSPAREPPSEQLAELQGEAEVLREALEVSSLGLCPCLCRLSASRASAAGSIRVWDLVRIRRKGAFHRRLSTVWMVVDPTAGTASTVCLACTAITLTLEPTAMRKLPHAL